MKYKLGKQQEICIRKQTEAHSAQDLTMLAINKYLKNTVIALYYQYYFLPRTEHLWIMKTSAIEDVTW